MTTKVEPTVEKWKGKVAILFAKHLAVAINPLTEDKDWLDNWESLREEMWGLLSHSLQEAKAEERERIRLFLKRQGLSPDLS